MKKVAIITLEQGQNYGGMLQAYALQKTIASLGFYAETTYAPQPMPKRLLKSLPFAKTALARLRGRAVVDRKTTTLYTNRFIEKYIHMVSFGDLRVKARRNQYASYVVGSDQVWRKPYANIKLNLFSFPHGDSSTISYAASFGRDDLNEYGSKLISKSKKLAQKMKAISVREDSGVDIVARYWGLRATHHVDPTILVSAEDYSGLIDANDDIEKVDGDLFSYILDPAKDKQGIALSVAKNRGFKVFTVIDGDENGGKPMPYVEQWIRSFRDAKYVVTDSFHGTVFSIIFNKPFIAIGNKERGIARFTSLLNVFGLEDRLVSDVREVTPELINAKINWEKVNAIKKREQKRSMDYLKRYLG